MISDELKTRGVESYIDGLDEVNQGWRAAFQDRDDDVGSLVVGTHYGAGRLVEHQGGDYPQARISTAGSKPVKYVQLALQVRVPELALRDDPNLFSEVSRSVGHAVSQAESTLGAALVNDLWTGEHSVYGNKPFFATDHPTADGAGRSNLIQSAPDLGGIFAAINLARNWVNYDGLNTDYANGGWHLLHSTISPGLEQQVGQALGSPVTSDQNQINVVGAYGVSQIPWAELVDQHRWAIFSKIARPLRFWTRQSANETFNITQDVDSRDIKWTVSLAAAAYAQPSPEGAVGSTGGG